MGNRKNLPQRGKPNPALSLNARRFYRKKIAPPGAVDGWITGLRDGWINGLVDGWINGLVDGWINGWVDGWINGLRDGWINGWVD